MQMLPGSSIDGPGSTGMTKCVENAEMNPHIYDEPFSRKCKSDFCKGASNTKRQEGAWTDTQARTPDHP